MSQDKEFPTLNELEYLSYIDENGQVTENFPGKIGVYAIFNQEKNLQFVGYSRDVIVSLKQHLVRKPDKCYWVKAHTIERPNRTILEEIEKAWIAENGSIPLGNDSDKEAWTQAINVQAMMTEAEQTSYAHPMNDDLAKMKVLKNVARRVEAEILAVLAARGLQAQIRFNPKLKEEGLLDLK
ncbi:GIY-YIG nuclease family protein [Calothrix sp. 336/3]|uniref:GIY-YIG nuclease family protein n=1 Tax=Calothrix sp. 336/3 TaxID=1337936 RepID=UPI0004E31AF9|nr:GIY-YIG nuclease family protein [Calothrix sp. 336/3]AKG22154.1 Nuclease subunit of the excinuclease complex [Calothrix sp. 336/3]